jgi:hypothetical protein
MTGTGKRAPIGAADGHPRARALRITYLTLGLSCVVAGAGFGLVADDVDATAMGLALAACTLALAGFLSQDGMALPRGRPVEPSEYRGLLPAAVVVFGLAIAAMASDSGVGANVVFVISVLASLGLAVVAFQVLLRG